MPTRIFKLALIGDGSVGKTSLRRRFMGENFEKQYLVTLGADFAVKNLEIDGENIVLQIWDLAGQEQFSMIRDRYYVNSNGILIVFDLTNPASFNNIPKWINEYMEVTNTLVPIVILGNKSDLMLIQELGIDKDEINDYLTKLQNWGQSRSSSFSVRFIETSAKTGHNVNLAFEVIAEKMILYKEDKLQ